MTRYTFFGILAAAGVLCTVFGAWAKIMHLAFANTLLTIGLFSEGIGITALLWFLFERIGKKNT
jgi:hypothetical protein